MNMTPLPQRKHNCCKIKCFGIGSAVYTFRPIRFKKRRCQCGDIQRSQISLLESFREIRQWNLFRFSWALLCSSHCCSAKRIVSPLATTMSRATVGLPTERRQYSPESCTSRTIDCSASGERPNTLRDTLR